MAHVTIRQKGIDTEEIISKLQTVQVWCVTVQLGKEIFQVADIAVSILVTVKWEHMQNPFYLQSQLSIAVES